MKTSRVTKVVESEEVKVQGKKKVKIRKLTEEDCNDIYEYAIKRSQEILSGEKD